ncbi:hypothetical protein SMICM17S_10916 [Streptomyces microflavus]
MRGATRTRWAACAVAVALAATACGGGGDDSGGSGADGIVSSSWGDPQNPLEPANTNEVQGGKVLDMVFRGLIRYDPKTGEAQNMLAESIDSSDAQNFTIKLKDGWTFSNGEKVTAKSFVDAWNYGAALKNNQKNAYFFQYIEGYDKVHPESGSASAESLSGLKVVDDLTFTAKLSQKFSLWPDTLGYSAFVPLPKAFYDDHDAWLSKPIGNGPYTIESYAKGSSMNLRKWDDYPGDDKAKNGGVDLKVFTDNNTAYTSLTSGNLDLVDDVPASQLRNVEQDLGDRYINTPAGIIQTLSFPFYDKEWDTDNARKVRQGLSMAINRKQITDQIFQKTRTPASDWTSPVLGEDGGFKEGLCGKECTYNKAEAKKLIDEGGGIPGGQLKISYNADTGSHKEWVDAVCNSINNVNGQQPGLRRRRGRHLRRLPQPGLHPEDDGPLARGLADGLPADPELPAAAVLHQRPVQRRQVDQPGLRRPGRQGERRDRQGEGHHHVPGRGEGLSSNADAVQSPLNWYQNGSARLLGAGQQRGG